MAASTQRSKKVFITGTSSGFGLLTVLNLIQNGHSVLAGLRGGSLRAEKFLPTLNDHQRRLIEQAQRTGHLSWIELDLNRSEDRLESLEWVKKNWDGRIDALVNNAGYGLLGPIESHTPDEVRAQFETNFFSTLWLSQIFIPYLRISKGALIQVSSVVGLYSLPFYGTYSASKHALEAVTEALSHELYSLGVRVHLIEPGGFRTQFSSQIQLGVNATRADSVYSERIQRFILAHKRKVQRFGADPTHVSKKIVSLVEHPSRRLRHLLGKDAWLLHAISRLLPDQMRLWMIRKVFGSAF